MLVSVEDLDYLCTQKKRHIRTQLDSFVTPQSLHKQNDDRKLPACAMQEREHWWYCRRSRDLRRVMYLLV
jgi:hypothetical protein